MLSHFLPLPTAKAMLNAAFIGTLLGSIVMLVIFFAAY